MSTDGLYLQRTYVQIRLESQVPVWGTLPSPVEGGMALLRESRVGGHGRAALLASLSCGSAKPQSKEAVVGGKGARPQPTPEKAPEGPASL